MNDLIKFLMLALAIATVSVTVTRSRAFAWLRVALADWPIVGEFVACAYCFAHWAAVYAMWLSSFALPLATSPWASVALTWLALVAAATVITRLMGGA